MESTAHRAIAIVGAGAILPDAPSVSAFWENIKSGRYSISEVTRDRWCPETYYDPDPAAPDKTYTKLGGWVRNAPWDPMAWHLPVPPRVAEQMDLTQRWAISCTREALEDHGRPLDPERTAVIIGNAMAGERHYLTATRLYFPEYVKELDNVGSFAALPREIREEIHREFQRRVGERLPQITEDTMPGELSNCIAGRIANTFNFRGPNFVTDAACASAMAAITAAAEGLLDGSFDAVVTGGVDCNMGPTTFIKFCKIGALSATGSRPYADGADGFIMGEGGVILLLKRLADAERDGDKIYAVLRGIGASSDGKGKGITAPNPIGQKLAVERAWKSAGLTPDSATFVEGHGTSTKVGDVVEVESLASVIGNANVAPRSIALGSVKSNFGHLKGAAGAAGILKTVLSLKHRLLPPSLNCGTPNPNIDFAQTPFFVNTGLRELPPANGRVNRAAVSAFGFGGTNFHAVFEEYVPGRLAKEVKNSSSVTVPSGTHKPVVGVSGAAPKIPLRGALLVGANSEDELVARLREIQAAAENGVAPAIAPPNAEDLCAPERIAIDYPDAKTLAARCASAIKTLDKNSAKAWTLLRSQGIFRGRGPKPKTAFLFPGQGSQYVNMLSALRASEPIVAKTFEEADRALEGILEKPLSHYIFVDATDENAIANAEHHLKQTAITQPAVLATDVAIARLLEAYGVKPDMTMGHSLGEYGALVASGAFPFGEAIEAVSARGRAMTRVSLSDNGKMAAVFAPLAKIDEVLASLPGYAVIANINSERQAVIGGDAATIDSAVDKFHELGFTVVPLHVSHAFHTSIVAPASEPLREVLEHLHLEVPKIPVVANVDGEFYPSGADGHDRMLDILSRQIAAPVQFVKGLRKLYDSGIRMFVEVGPKRVLQGLVDDVLGDNPGVIAISTNHPKLEDAAGFNYALCALYAAGLGQAQPSQAVAIATPEVSTMKSEIPSSSTLANDDRILELGRIFADALQRGRDLLDSKPAPVNNEAVVITGAALGLPGTERIFDDMNVARILEGEQFIKPIPPQFRQAMVDKHVVRLVKSELGGPTFETISNVADVIKLAGRGGQFDFGAEFGIKADRLAALDRVTQLAMAAGIDALRNAGIPLVMRYRDTTKGTKLPDRWMLPESMRDDTGIIFASAFPGYDALLDEVNRFHEDRATRAQIELLESILATASAANGHGAQIAAQVAQQIDELRKKLREHPYLFDRRFLFKTLSMGHSQFAEYIGARGPNTAINAACATTSQAMAIAEDWVRAGRCARVIIISSDDVTSDRLLEWIGAGFLASGAAATDERVEDAATPFDRRRHGMLIGMGAVSIIVESQASARERGIRPICEVLSTITANSAYHGTRLDVQHIGNIMETVVSNAERLWGIRRHEIAAKTVFVSHETYTPARGGSASAEIHALRKVFGDRADHIVIANTKGFTGHAMATGIEEVVAIKSLETGVVPPVANFREVDPELGTLNLSKGGRYPIEYALRLAAGFGSQVSMSLMRWVATPTGRRPSPRELDYTTRIADQRTWNAWLARVSGQPNATLEVVNHTLRVRQDAATSTKPVETEAVKPASTVAAPVIAAEPVASTAPAAPVPQPAADDPKQRVLKIAAEKTGYPIEMLDLDLDLEADLGIDTVKQAEMFAAIRESYGIARDDKIRLRDFPTLAHVIKFVNDRRAHSVPTTTTVEPAPPQPATASAVNVSAAPNSVEERVLALVVEKTGYPKEMLDRDLDLEADLGIDTVKQAEMFAAIREAYDIPRDPNLRLRDFPTLAHVVKFVFDRRPDLASQVEVIAATAASAQQTATLSTPGSRSEAEPSWNSGSAPSLDDDIRNKVLDIAAEKTGYPKEMLDLDLDLEADLGVDTVKQAEMFAAIREAYGIARDPNLKLRDFPTLAHIIGFARARLTTAPPPAPQAQATQPASPAETVIETAEPASTGGVTHEHVRRTVLTIAAEKTGYPIDMLALDLDLEADLGVDTVKQAEMFAAIRESYNIARDPNLKLRDFPTLGHIIEFALTRAAATAPIATPAADESTQTEAPREETPRHIVASFEAANRVPRRIPVPLVRPAVENFCTTGVELGKKSRVLIMPDEGGTATALAKRLKKSGAKVALLDRTKSIDALVEDARQFAAEGLTGLYWLPALDAEASLFEMSHDGWRESTRVRIKALYAVARALYENLAASGTFFLSATRLGGHHGYDHAGAFAPLGGAVTGFTKALHRERAEATVKAIDFAASAAPAEIVDTLIAETLKDPAAFEVGYCDGLRCTIGIDEQPAPEPKTEFELNRDTVFVVTGAAGSIVSAITSDLATASAGTFYLLDLVPEPNPEDSDLKRFSTDRDGLKLELAARMQARGERPTPAKVERELAALERLEAARAAIAAIHDCGGTAHYFSVNLTDGAAVERVIETIRERHGRVDVLLHAAGIERSHFLFDKEPKEFDLVFDVKAEGFFNLLHAIGDMPLGAVVGFSSVAGRFGNGGQTDYSSANDFLCKTISHLRSARPTTRGIAIDWTAWGGIGMATRGSIPKMMEVAGIDMLPPEAGIPIIRRELTAGTRAEMVIGQRLGILLQEPDSAASLEIRKVAHAAVLQDIASASTICGLRFEATLDPARQPFLNDHRIEGKPVLPGVMGIECFAEAARAIAPDWHLAAIEDVNFVAPFKFYRDEPRTVTVEAQPRIEGDELVVDCKLIGTRQLPTQTEPQSTIHFTGRVRLTQKSTRLSHAQPIAQPHTSTIEAADIYGVYFHGPAYQVLQRAWRSGDTVVGEMATTLPANHEPAKAATTAAPRLIELCFQTAGLWELGVESRFGLPLHVDRIFVHSSANKEATPLFSVVTPDAANGSFDAHVQNADGKTVLEVRGYRTVALPDAKSSKAFEVLLSEASVTAS